MPDLKVEISSLGGIYKRYAKPLQKLRIYRFGDFLFHIPFRYVDYSLISKIGDLQEGEIVTIRGKVVEIKNNYTRRFRTLQKAKVEDSTGVIDVIWFNQPYLVKNIKKGDVISLSGKVEKNINKLIFKSPDYEAGEGESIHTGRLVPIYPETRGISSKWLRKQIYLLLKQNDSLSDFIPEKIKKTNGLLDLSESIQKIH
ncbi:MAG: DNA helicase RecG, partial [Candidatus Levybacteria bacterium]|nr:DNA helicase RecG [Candidatus Levybacteria bacterium]